MALAFDSFVLAAATADLDDEPRARAHADAVEYRMDLAAAAGDDPLAALDAYDGDLPVIATNRAEREGGSPGGGERARLDALVAAAEREAVGAVDVELDAVTDGDGGRIVDRARAHDAAAIVSVHDFETTPPPERMRATLDAAAARGDVAKLAVTAADRGDVLDLLSATHAATEAGTTVATMAMGAAGRHSRAVAPLYGSTIGYAPVAPAGATAPGQYDLSTLAGLVERLEDDVPGTQD